jgi:Spy/CpxP family protein refolding chaperone
MKRLIALSTLILSCSLTQIPVAFAGDWGHQCHIEKLAHKLHLTTEQNSKVKAIITESRKKLEPIHQQMKAIKEKLEQAFIAGNLSGFKERALVREEKDLIDTAIDIRLHESEEISNVLTVKQRTELVNLKHKWKKEHSIKKHI